MNTKPIFSFEKAVNLSKPYWIMIAALWLMGFCYVVMYGTFDSFLRLTTIHTPFLDSFFSLFTNVGDGLFAVAVGIVFFVFKYRRIACNILFSFLLSGLLAQIGKNLMPFLRPSAYFRDVAGIPVHTLEATVWGNKSFPSGHSTTAFALLGVLILFYPTSRWNILWVLLAFLVGYSRIYLASHFLDDVLAGAAIGVFTAMICYIISNNLFYKKLNYFPR